MLGKLFNKNKLKISYSCLPNLEARICAHNKSLLSKPQNLKSCNCQKSRVCPLNGKCVVEDCIYKAEVVRPEQGQKEHVYIGLAGGLFKKRLANHQQSFRDRNKIKFSELSKFVWKLQDQGIYNYSINWTILSTEKGYDRRNGKCGLCLREQLEILKASYKVGRRLINKREELFTGCIHRYRHQLGVIDTNNISINEINNFANNMTPEENITSGSLRSGRLWRNYEND